MKLSISNIGWSSEWDETVYSLMQKYGYSSLEVAPTKLYPDKPYDKLCAAEQWSRELKKTYGFSVSSMQSIWFGRKEKLFGSAEERKVLLNYTKKAINFAAAIGCKNLVFGCPRNRELPEKANDDSAVAFFKELGGSAALKGTAIGLEANPPIYHTNYINDTMSAIKLIEQVNSSGFMLNLDVGTMLYNGENVGKLADYVHLINHVHISEPNLRPIEFHELHQKLKKILIKGMYSGTVSIETGKIDNISVIEDALRYVKGVFS